GSAARIARARSTPSTATGTSRCCAACAPPESNAASPPCAAPRARESVFAPPVSGREIEEPVNAAVAVPRDVPLVVTEGNYLLVDEGPWAAVRGLLDEGWDVVQDDATRVRLLVARHVAFGRAPDVAREWVLRSDERNAELVATT